MPRYLGPQRPPLVANSRVHMETVLGNNLLVNVHALENPFDAPEVTLGSGLIGNVHACAQITIRGALNLLEEAASSGRYMHAPKVPLDAHT